MKKLIMLISLLLVSLTVFSQKDTTTNTKTFSIPVVKLIVKDLLSGDSAKAQLALTEKQLIETETKLGMKDSVISLLRSKESTYQKIIDSEVKKNEMLTQYSTMLQNDLKNTQKKYKTKSILYGGIIIALTTLLIIK